MCFCRLSKWNFWSCLESVKLKPLSTSLLHCLGYSYVFPVLFLPSKIYILTCKCISYPLSLPKQSCPLIPYGPKGFFFYFFMAEVSYRVNMPSIMFVFQLLILAIIKESIVASSIDSSIGDWITVGCLIGSQWCSQT